jgi:hypothetical protein
MVFSYTLALSAQQTGPKTTANENYISALFQIDHLIHVGLKGVKANSQVRFYKTPQGGKMLKRGQTDLNGNLDVSFSMEQVPAFVLGNGLNSTNQVQHFKGIEFAVNNISFVEGHDMATLSLEYQVFQKEGMLFQIESSNEGETKIVKTLEVNANNRFENLSEIIEFDAAASYVLHVLWNGETWYSKTLHSPSGDEVSSATKTNVQVYPNPCTHFITVNSGDKKVDAVYVYTLDGKQVYTQTTSLTDKINLSDLDPAFYILELTFEDSTTERIKLEKQ